MKTTLEPPDALLIEAKSLAARRKTTLMAIVESVHLLDINVMIALCDPAHPHATAARRFFRGGIARDGWATCPHRSIPRSRRPRGVLLNPDLLMRLAWPSR